MLQWMRWCLGAARGKGETRGGEEDVWVFVVAGLWDRDVEQFRCVGMMLALLCEGRGREKDIRIRVKVFRLVE